MLSLNREQVALAVKTGLDILGQESDVVVPVKYNDGVFFLKMLLNGIGTGAISLAAGGAVPSAEGEPPPPPPTGKGPPANRKAKRQSKKKK